MGAHETLEHAEPIAHGGHGEHGDHDHGGDQSLGMKVGVTMAILGVLLAFCAARVGAERTELVEALVDQQDAHAKSQAVAASTANEAKAPKSDGHP
jgi:hypothetical protein